MSKYFRHSPITGSLKSFKWYNKNSLPIVCKEFHPVGWVKDSDPGVSKREDEKNIKQTPHYQNHKKADNY